MRSLGPPGDAELLLGGLTTVLIVAATVAFVSGVSLPLWVWVAVPVLTETLVVAQGTLLLRDVRRSGARKGTKQVESGTWQR